MTDAAPTLRRAHPGEASAISALAIRSKAWWGYSEEFMQACRDELAVTASAIETGPVQYTVAEQHDTLLGYFGIEAISADQFELDALFVEPDHIGKGIGKLLIEAAKRAAREMGGSTLLIQGDPNAEAFYLASGAVQCGIRESGSIEGRRLPLFLIELSA